MTFFEHINLNTSEFVLAFTAAFLMGVSKSGIKGLSILFITMMALVFGAKASTGIMVPFLMIGDIIAVVIFKRDANWKYFFKMIPWMIIGVLIGVYFGKDLPEQVFQNLFLGIILFSLFMMLWWEKKKSSLIPRSNGFAMLMGLSAGFTTMLGNLAGAFSNIYFLSIRIPKKEFIGTTAFLFFFINIFKFPFHFFVWETITKESLKINLLFAPAILLGFYIGLKLVDRINEILYRKMIIGLTVLGVLTIIWKYYL